MQFELSFWSDSKCKKKQKNKKTGPEFKAQNDGWYFSDTVNRLKHLNLIEFHIPKILVILKQTSSDMTNSSRQQW